MSVLRAPMLSLVFLGFVLFALVNCLAISPEELHAKLGKSGEQVHRINARASDPDPTPKIPFLRNTTQEFYVLPGSIPELDFDAGPSYAGLLPISNNTKDGSLFFWFWPAAEPNEDSQDLIIWLNGGPGCSSMIGLLQENGPFMWAPGMHRPVQNPWSWNKLANVLYVEQPIGTGFSTGPITIKNEDDLSRQFMGFMKNFMDRFVGQSPAPIYGWPGLKIYLTGESYAGMYLPYIASNMIKAKDKWNFNVHGMLIYDGVIGDFDFSTRVAAKSALDIWRPILPLNDTAMAWIANKSEACGYDAFVDKHFTFPPSGRQASLTTLRGQVNNDCDVWYYIKEAAMEINGGFDIYQISKLQQDVSDPMGFPKFLGAYSLPSPSLYFNRTDVKLAIHAPLDADWSVCSFLGVFDKNRDQSLPPSISGVLPHVINETQNVMISHGTHDWILLMAGNLLAIQNMTWGGAMGFQRMPSDPLFVPHYPQYGDHMKIRAGHGVLGTTHTERGLTWSVVNLAGHMVPQFQPAVAFRQIEVLLGQVESLNSTKPFSVFLGHPQPEPAELGRGTAPALGRLLQAKGTPNISTHA